MKSDTWNVISFQTGCLFFFKTSFQLRSSLTVSLQSMRVITKKTLWQHSLIHFSSLFLLYNALETHVTCSILGWLRRW